ncbi:MAG TPA: hypothetical protein DG753_12100 [Clostridium sp.]|nr:hypothetical protein [Clostridium sp.]
MAGNSSDVIINEAEFLKAASQCKQYCEKLQTVINTYQEIMNSMITFGIKDRLITNNVGVICLEIMKYAPMLEDIGIEINKLVKQYLVDIDRIDKFNY